MIPLRLLVAALFGWLEQEQRDIIDFLREENRVLEGQLHGRRLRLCDVCSVSAYCPITQATSIRSE